MESTKRTCRPATTRTQQDINDTSKAAGRGAERLRSMTARGVYHQSLLRLSVSQGSVGLLDQEQPSWHEEREQLDTWCNMGSPAPQQRVLQENTEDEEDLREIPSTT